MKSFIHNARIDELDDMLDALLKEQSYFIKFIAYIDNLESLYNSSEKYDLYHGFNKNVKYSTLLKVLGLDVNNKYTFEQLVNIAHVKVSNLRIDNIYALDTINNRITDTQQSRAITILNMIGYYNAN